MERGCPSGSAPWKRRVRAAKTELSEWPSTVTERWSGLGSVREFRGNSHVLLLCSITGSHVSLVCGTVVS